MKIDIHTHTKKCKSGDAQTREIAPLALCETVMATDVGILAITNHNVFDLAQYKEVQKIIGDDTQIWPGIELDVLEGGLRGHLLVIASPRKVEEFSNAINELTKKTTPDNFTISIDQIIKTFESFKPIYVAHYKQKAPSLSDEVLNKLTSGISNTRRVIREVTNSISAGIYIAHGYPSIYGSDVQDWSIYEDLSHSLPDLRLPVESFEHFCLLLEKDPTTINTLLDKKYSEYLELTPFEDDTIVKLKVFNDINIVFGPKGTGKSCILRAIAKHYSDNGLEADVYESASDRLDDIFDIKGRDLSLNLTPFGINYCKDEIEELREASEVGVTSLSKYVTYFHTRTTSRNAKKIRIKDIDPEDESVAKQEFNEFHEAVKRAQEFLEFIKADPAVKKVLDDTELDKLTSAVLDLFKRLNNREWDSYSTWKEIGLLNTAIAKFRTEVERKTGSPAKPTATGFREYALNRAKIEANALTIIRSFDTEIPKSIELIGSLGPDKGELEVHTVFRFQNGAVTDGSLNKLKNIKKSSLKHFARTVRDIKDHAYKSDLFQYITALNDIEDVERIETVYELLLFKKYFAIAGHPYTPSSGESSMVMLNKELETDKEVYILDEPERSLGNEYISDVIVPLIKERARAGKRIFISTHDANIAVRTLPYSSIYRCHGPDGYASYVGNPFSNNLVNPDNDADRLDWKKVSMRTLEGGVEAFGERGKIYGNG